MSTFGIPAHIWREDPYYPRLPGPSIPFTMDPENPRAALHNSLLRSEEIPHLLQQEYMDITLPRYAQSERYRRLADSAYQPILFGGGGFSPQEQQRLLREGDLQSLQMTPQEREASFLAPHEYAGISGDPYRAFDYYNPGQMLGIAESTRDRLREALASGEQGVYGAIDPGNLQMSPDYAGALRATSGNLATGIDQAIDPSLLRLSESFAAGYPLSDAEITGLTELAGGAVADRYQQDINNLRYRSLASGNVSPLAVQTASENMRRRSAAEGADAAARAKLAGLDTQREQRRRLEEMRLAAESGLSDRELQALFGLSGFQRDIETNIEGTRLGAERDLSDRLLRGTEFLTGSRLGAEEAAGSGLLGASQYAQGLGTGLSERAEQRGSDRAGQLAGNRQATQRYLQDERFDRGFGINQLLANRYRDIYGQRKAEEQEGRGYLTGQQGLQSELYEGGANRRLGGLLDANRIGLQAGQGLADYEIGKQGTPGFWERLLNNSMRAGAAWGGGAAHGDVVDGAQLRLVGEAGPEAIIPLSPMTDGSFTLNPSPAGPGVRGSATVTPPPGGVNYGSGYITDAQKETVRGQKKRKPGDRYNAKHLSEVNVGAY